MYGKRKPSSESRAGAPHFNAWWSQFSVDSCINSLHPKCATVLVHRHKAKLLRTAIPSPRLLSVSLPLTRETHSLLRYSQLQLPYDNGRASMASIISETSPYLRFDLSHVHADTHSLSNTLACEYNLTFRRRSSSLSEAIRLVDMSQCITCPLRIFCAACRTTLTLLD